MDNLADAAGSFLYGGVIDNCKLTDLDNLADAAGSFLYGGVIDNCKVTDLDSYSSGEVFDKIAHNEDESITSRHIILSVLLRICPCNNSYPYILCI